MAVFAGKNGGTDGTAKRIGHEAAVETHAFRGEAIDVGRFDEVTGIIVRADRLVSVIVGEDKNDVRARLAAKRAASCEKQSRNAKRYSCKLFWHQATSRRIATRAATDLQKSVYAVTRSAG